MAYGNYPEFTRQPKEFASLGEWMAAAREHYSHQFDVDPVEFEEVWGVSVEHAAKYNDSWTGQYGFHACPSQPCIDSIDSLFAGVRGKVCWCDCHAWNKPHGSATKAEGR